MLLPLLYACREEEPKPDVPTEDTAEEPDPEPSDTGETDTGAEPAPERCATWQDVTSGGLASGWVSPSGTLYALGTSLAARVRAPDGTWSLDPVDEDLDRAMSVHGADDSEVWGLTYSKVLQRQADGDWSDRGAPYGDARAQTLHVFGPDDVVVLLTEDIGCDDCYARDTPILLWWDGSSWTEQREEPLDSYVYDMTVLPDRRVVLAVGELGLWTTGPDRVQIPMPFESYVRVVVSAPDGTLVALADNGIAMGTVEGGLVAHDPGVQVDEWNHAWASSASDVWLLGTRWEQGVIPRSTVMRYDGSQWTLIAESTGLFSLTGGGSARFALGAYDHELVLSGDSAGLQVERELWGPDYLEEIVVDDVTGQAWSYGYSPVLGVYEQGSWTGLPLPDSELRVDGLAVSDARVVLHSNRALHLLQAGALTTMETEYTSWRALAGADGVLFAAGLPDIPDGPVQYGVTLLRDAGAGWETIDTSTLPEIAEPASLWADGPDDLWLGLQLGDQGGLAHWDGSAWTLVLEALSDGPSFLRRLPDGQLYFTQTGEGTDSLWVYDGQDAYSLLEMPPDVRAAHVLPDGTWFVSAIAIAATGDEDSYGLLLQRDPGGDWVEVFTEDYSIALAGTSDTVWAERAELSWTLAACDP